MLNERIVKRIWSIFGQVEKQIPPGVAFDTRYGTGNKYATFTLYAPKKRNGDLPVYQFLFPFNDLDFDGRDPERMNELTRRVDFYVRTGLQKLGLI